MYVLWYRCYRKDIEMEDLKIKGRLDRIGKTALEHFKDIEEIEVADGQCLTIKNLLPYKCEQIEQALQRLEEIDNANTSEVLELFYYLLKHFSYRSYNPKGKYCVVAFTIDDENINDKLSEFLYGPEFYKER